jgi:phosphomannomutase
MRKVFIFDVDGTLTPSRRRMTEDFARFFDSWSKENTFYLVSGSDLDKIKEQIPIAYLDRAEGVFTCGGNKFYIDDELIYENKFKPPETLLTYLGFQVKISDTPVKSTNHREDRDAMLNFSVVGRNCTLEERQQYFEYDKKTGEREKIAAEVKRGWPGIDAVIGGQISIDIAPIGNDKSQVIKKIKDDYNIPFMDGVRYIFVGDRTMEGGNDYPLAKVMNEMHDCEVYQAGEPSQEDGYKITQRILEEEMND